MWTRIWATLKQLIVKASSQVHYMSTQAYIDYFLFHPFG
jgi:hypothetical protein